MSKDFKNFILGGVLPSSIEHFTFSQLESLTTSVEMNSSFKRANRIVFVIRLLKPFASDLEHMRIMASKEVAESEEEKEDTGRLREK